MRRPFIAGNWKMNLDLPSARSLIAEVRSQVSGKPPVDIAVCPPSIYLFPMAKALAESTIDLGAQNCWHEANGAFTGECSATMVRETGCKYVILGHSERRHTIGYKDAAGCIHGETDEIVSAKVIAALGVGLIPIVCIGETLAERDAGETDTLLTRQIQGSLAGLTADAARAIVLAYEPVWAIGTGRTATPQIAQEAHAHIRGELARLFGHGVADEIRIQYGGSVKPDNVADLMVCPDVDGALVGGASLKATDFIAIIEGSIQACSLS